MKDSMETFHTVAWKGRALIPDARWANVNDNLGFLENNGAGVLSQPFHTRYGRAGNEQHLENNINTVVWIC